MAVRDRRQARRAELEVDEVAVVELHAAVAEVRVDERGLEADLVAVRAGVIAGRVRQPVDLVGDLGRAAAVDPAGPVRGLA
ncbi:MAG: hypothetical protein ACRDL8_14845, partial [Solirubrobacteraceae bacterium]